MEKEATSKRQIRSALNQPKAVNTPQGASASRPLNVGTHSQSHPTSAIPAASTTSSDPAPPSTTAITSSASNSKRRGRLGMVTPNACKECRKKRIKCDGSQPCSRCRAQNGIVCVYEVPVRQSKKDLRKEIENLRSRQRHSETVIAALARPQLGENILDGLRRGETLENISTWLAGMLPSGSSITPDLHRSANSNIDTGPNTIPQPRSGGPSCEGSAAMSLAGSSNLADPPEAHLPPIMRNDSSQGSPWLSARDIRDSSRGSGAGPMNWELDVLEPPQYRVGFWGNNIDRNHISDAMPRLRGLEEVMTPLQVSGTNSSIGSWTSITSDTNLVQHLLALYFCWEYPTFASLSKEHFLRDFYDGRDRYCSSTLVNALLALGCRFSTKPATRADQSDPYSSGDHFFKESQRLLYQEKNHHSLPTIQALGIMSIREASCGRDFDSRYYVGQSVRLTVEMGLHRVSDESDEDEQAVQAATFWGAFALDHAWSLATGSLPRSFRFPRLPPKPAIIEQVETSLWVPYTDDGVPLQRSGHQPSNVRSVYRCFCELSELVHQSLYTSQTPGRHLTARDLLKRYASYLEWYHRIPESLRLGHNFTPAVLFVHMYYHFAILLLFRPFIKLRIKRSTISTRDVCCEAANSILGLSKSYSQLYTLRRTPAFVPYFVLTAATTHLAISVANTSNDSQDPAPENLEAARKLDPRVSDSLKQGMLDLVGMVPCHRFAGQAVSILGYLAKKWNVKVDIESEKLTLEGFDRIIKPYPSSAEFFASNVQDGDSICNERTAQGTRNLVSTKADEATAIQNAGDTMVDHLCWPFPLQGQPKLGTGQELKQTGFSLL